MLPGVKPQCKYDVRDQVWRAPITELFLINTIACQVKAETAAATIGGGDAAMLAPGILNIHHVHSTDRKAVAALKERQQQRMMSGVALYNDAGWCCICLGADHIMDVCPIMSNNRLQRDMIESEYRERKHIMKCHEHGYWEMQEEHKLRLLKEKDIFAWMRKRSRKRKRAEELGLLYPPPPPP